MVIDLRRMNRVDVDPSARRARVQGGALLGDVDAATQPYGLAVPAGLVSHTGVGGLTLGGGMGWLTRMAGLTIDHLVSAEVVLADSRVVRADESENPDLFWALRGGGGNFGVVTEFEFDLVAAGPMVQFGLFFWDAADGREALRVMRDVLADLPRSMNAMPAAAFNAPPAPFVPAEHQGKPGYALLLVGFGERGGAPAGDRADPHGAPAAVRRGHPDALHRLQQLIDEANGWGLYSYDKSGYFADLTDEVIDVLCDQAPRKTSPMSLLLFYRLDGAYSDVAEDATAFGGGRSPRYTGFFIGITPTAEMLPAEREWIRSLWQALQPHMLAAGSYVNAVEGAAGEAEDAYGPKFRRLVAVKAAYDPDNVFHRNVNIPVPTIPTQRS